MADWSAVGRRSRSKGKRHEREIARILRVVTGSEWMTTRNSGRTDLGGDVFCPGNFCTVMVEAKHRASFKLSDMVLGNVGYTGEIAKVLVDWEDRPEYVVLVILVKNDCGLWVTGRTRRKELFAASRPAVLLRCAARMTWSYAGKGEANQSSSSVLRQLVDWMATVS